MFWSHVPTDHLGDGCILLPAALLFYSILFYFTFRISWPQPSNILGAIMNVSFHLISSSSLISPQSICCILLIPRSLSCLLLPAAAAFRRRRPLCSQIIAMPRFCLTRQRLWSGSLTHPKGRVMASPPNYFITAKQKCLCKTAASKQGSNNNQETCLFMICSNISGGGGGTQT